MTTIRVSSNGRLTIPAAIRRQRGWEPGTRLRVEERDDGIFLRRLCAVTELRGILRDYAKPGTTWEQEREAAEQSMAEEAMEGMK